MKELSDILQAYRSLVGKPIDAALATVVRVEGSAYRRAGAQMLVTGGGQIVGGVSGGCLERDVIQRAGSVISSGACTLVRYDTSRDPQGGTGYSLGCGGTIDILIEPLNTAAGAQMMDWLAASESKCVTCATVISRHHPQYELGHRLWVDHAGHVQGTLGDLMVAQTLLSVDRSQNMQLETGLGTVDIFIQVLHPPLQLIIFGAGNDALPLVEFAHALGWKTTVVDLGSSPMDLGRNWEPGQTIRCQIDDVACRVRLNQSSAVVVMTHNFNHDSKLIRWLSTHPLRYLGLLGPRHRTDEMLGDMQPVTLHSPVGLDLGADNPQEVALAIVAEITAVIRGRAGGHLTTSAVPIHVHSHEVKEITCPVAAS